MTAAETAASATATNTSVSRRPSRPIQGPVTLATAGQNRSGMRCRSLHVSHRSPRCVGLYNRAQGQRRLASEKLAPASAGLTGADCPGHGRICTGPAPLGRGSATLTRPAATWIRDMPHTAGQVRQARDSHRMSVLPVSVFPVCCRTSAGTGAYLGAAAMPSPRPLPGLAITLSDCRQGAYDASCAFRAGHILSSSGTRATSEFR
jgi:hypothetical protein